MGKRKGSITVFMSLAGLLILAMVGTCVETARYATCAGTGTEMLRNGADALLTEYSRPLYDHYGLFFVEDTGIPFERVIAGYVGDSIEGKEGFYDFLKGELRSLKVTKKTHAGDDDAGALMKEIKAYMERYITGEQCQKILDKLSHAESSETQAKQIEEGVEEEREDKKLDERILRLMKLVDGVSISHGGGISVGSYFAKKFAVKRDFTGLDFGVSEGTVWSQMKNKIDKTPAKWKTMDSGFRKKLDRVIEKTEDAIEEGKKLREEYAVSKHSDMAERVIAGLSSLDGNLVVLKKTKEILDGGNEEKKKINKKLKSLWKDYDTASLSFDYSGADSAGGDDESPLKALGSSIGEGLLSLVCKNPKEISEKAIKKADRYANYYKEETTAGTDYSDRIGRLADDEEVELSGVFSDIGSFAMDEIMLDSYITKRFPGYTDQKPAKEDWKRSLSYGWEYVVSGNKSDKENLESVISKILLLRIVTNFIAITADSAKRAEAFAAAVAVVGFTGLVFLIRFTQTLFLIVWAVVESMTDVAAILMDKDVPIVKTSKSIKTTFPEILLINNSSIVGRAERYPAAKKTSFGYKEYIYLFLETIPARVRRYRVMDLIESDMKKNGYKSFSMGKCVFDMTVTADYYYPAKLFRFPLISNLLQRDLSGYTYSAEIRAGYL